MHLVISTTIYWRSTHHEWTWSLIPWMLYFRVVSFHLHYHSMRPKEARQKILAFFTIKTSLRVASLPASATTPSNSARVPAGSLYCSTKPITVSTTGERSWIHRVWAFLLEWRDITCCEEFDVLCKKLYLRLIFCTCLSLCQQVANLGQVIAVVSFWKWYFSTTL